jgi:exopolysaccharide production protein ExoQ
MSTKAFAIQAEVLGIRARINLFPAMVGFFFVFRVCLTFLFFQTNPILGTVISIAVDFVLLYGAILYSVHEKTVSRSRLIITTPIWWLLAYLAFSLSSLFWTETQSVGAAFTYWSGMAADVVIVLFLFRQANREILAEALMKGAVWGAILLSVIAWCSPATEDLRLGNDAFLHPNTLGFEVGVGALVAQYLTSQAAHWKWSCITLAVTLLRTLSKTAIIAFVIVECWYLVLNRDMPRKTKLRIGAGALFVIVSFWSLLDTYINIYNNMGSGNQAETLTGRTLVWAAALSMSLEKPWLGHGVYSFKSLIPSFGNFQPVHAHNEFLQQFFEYGVIGVLIVAGAYWSFYMQARQSPKSDLRTLVFVLLFFALLRGLADTANFGLSYPLWIFTALSICLASRSPLDERAR